jgi:tight adherence protein B
MPPLPTLIVAGLIFLAVALGTIAIALLFEFLQERLRARTVVKQLHEFSEKAFSAETGSLVRQGTETSWLEGQFARLPRFRDLGRVLRESGTNWSFQSFVVVSLGLGMAFALGLATFSRSIFGALVGFPLGALIPYFILRFKAGRRMGKIEEQLPDAIDLMGRAMRAGHPLSSGFKMVADEAPEPIASEFRQVFEEQRFGLPFDDSLLALGERIRVSDIRILVTAILIHRQVGGNLAEVLDNIAALVRERFKLRRQLRVITAQGRLSGYVLALMPFALGLAIFTLNREYMMPIFEQEIGRFMLVGALIFQVLGYMWIRKILDIEF